MTLIDKALWYLNGHFAEEFSLDDASRAIIWRTRSGEA
jgi:hypothetical protein